MEPQKFKINPSTLLNKDSTVHLLWSLIFAGNNRSGEEVSFLKSGLLLDIHKRVFELPISDKNN